jgi:hypothetical protein
MPVARREALCNVQRVEEIMVAIWAPWEGYLKKGWR